MSVIVSMPTRCIVLSGRMCISLYVEVQTLNRPVLRGSVLNSFSGSYDITEPHRLFSSSLLCSPASLGDCAQYSKRAASLLFHQNRPNMSTRSCPSLTCNGTTEYLLELIAPDATTILVICRWLGAREGRWQGRAHEQIPVQVIEFLSCVTEMTDSVSVGTSFCFRSPHLRRDCCC